MLPAVGLDDQSSSSPDVPPGDVPPQPELSDLPAPPPRVKYFEKRRDSYVHNGNDAIPFDMHTCTKRLRTYAETHCQYLHLSGKTMKPVKPQVHGQKAIHEEFRKAMTVIEACDARHAMHVLAGSEGAPHFEGS